MTGKKAIIKIIGAILALPFGIVLLLAFLAWAAYQVGKHGII